MRPREKEKIIPFMWMNKETHEEIIAELEYIKSLGLTSVMLESRVHKDFCGEKWFDEMDVVMKFARENDMKVWLLDDRSYPSGYGNGIYQALGSVYRARFVIAKKTDVVGEMKNAKIIVALEKEDRLVGAFLCKREGIDKYSTAIDVTENVHGNFLYVDIPDGEYSIFLLIDTPNAEERKFYLDMLSKKSVDKFIEAVYEKHYQRYSADFGITFMGFFSDEPRFANGRYVDSIQYKSKIRSRMGEFGTAYPFNKTVEQSFENPSDILSLWFDMGEETSKIRCAYMELITDIMSENFPKRLSDWCQKRNVLYAGHIIEDNGNHASLGCSLGHYFKSQKGMNMASVDIVLHQIKPYDINIPHFGPIGGGYGYPEFFNYTLLKLASSCARLDKEKQGRALCEIFGAYGWGESTCDMLYLTNLCIAQGINRFIPHAFTHQFGLKDCPPHFYAGGRYTINEHHKALFSYMNKMCEIFDGGEAQMDYAVLYHAQAEWSGKDYSFMDGVMRILSDYQLGTDIVDFEHLVDAKICDGGILIAGRKYKKLVCPYFESLPKKYIEILNKLQEHTVFAQKGNENLTAELFGVNREKKVGLYQLNYSKNDKEYTFLFNGSKNTIVVQNEKHYDYALDYVLGYALPVKEEFTLTKGQAVLLTNDTDGLPVMPTLKTISEADKFDVLVKGFNEDNFSVYKNGANVDFDINSYDNLPDFSGAIKYLFELKQADYIEIEYDGDGLIFNQGNCNQSSIGGLAIFNINDNAGKSAEIELINSFAYYFKDRYSMYNYIAPTKINKVRFLKKA